MTRKVFSFAVVLTVFLAFAGEAWCSVVGRWNTTGDAKVVVNMDGMDPIARTAKVQEVLIFNKNRTFRMDKVTGKWRIKDDKVVVALDPVQIEDYLEAMLRREGVRTEVEVTNIIFNVTEIPEKNRIKGRAVMRMNIKLLDYFGLKGKARMQVNFQGKRAVTANEFSLDDPARPTMLLETFESLRQALP